MPLPYCYEHPRPAVTVDNVVFAFDGDEIKLLLIKRKSEPHAGKWSLPGGFMGIDERLHEAALRELVEETGLRSLQELHLIGIFDAVKRDPRGRVLSVAFGGLVRWPASVREGDDASAVRWVDLDGCEGLAFDHKDILDQGLKWLSLSVMAGTGALSLLPESFKTDQVRRLFSALGAPARSVSPWLKRMTSEGAISPKTERQKKAAKPKTASKKKRGG